MRTSFAAAVAALLIVLPRSQAKEPDLSSPKAVLLSYVQAVKAGDYDTAKRCWVIDGKDQDGAMEVVVGLWTATRRARVAVVQKFGPASNEALGKFDRADVSDEALDRTLSRVKNSEADVKDDRATLAVRWEEDDGSKDVVFLFGREPLPFRKVGATWRLDATAHTGGDAESVLKPGTWGPLFRDYTRMMNEVADGVASEKIKSKEEVAGLIDQKGKAAAERYKEALGKNPPSPPKRP
jgi:hypothetical protein